VSRRGGKDGWLARLLGASTAAPPSIPPPPGPGITREHVVWAYRLLLDREPENERVVDNLTGVADTRQLRAALVTSAEYADKNPDYAQANSRTLVIKELESGVRLVVDLADHAIGLNIIRGRFEANELAFARSIVAAGDHVLDCGAHIGLFAIHLAQWVGPSGSVHAFEPFDGNADCLERAIAENRFGDRLTLERAAVGAAPGSMTLVYAAESLNSGGAFLAPAGTAIPLNHATRPVEVMALDHYPLPRPIRFMKIDVEGAEPLVMHGAAAMLAADRPVILSELHPSQLQLVSGVSAAAYIAQLRALGYRCHGLEAGGRPGPEIADMPSGPDVVSVAFIPLG
jgi:FkbM family methyltransferase